MNNQTAMDILKSFNKDGIYIYGWAGGNSDQYAIYVIKNGKKVYDEQFAHFRHTEIFETLNNLNEEYNLQVYNASKYWYSMFGHYWYTSKGFEIENSIEHKWNIPEKIKEK